MSCHLSVGSKKTIAFVFSCPGQNEEKAGYPAAKATGTNLSLLLIKLANKLNYDVLRRSEITITNAWDQVEYKELTNRSEASDYEIKSETNIHRLSNELRDISEIIVCCGDKALLAVRECVLQKQPQIVILKHLGNKGLNSIKHDVKGKSILSAKKIKALGDKRSIKTIGKDNTALRLEIIANDIAAQLKI